MTPETPFVLSEVEGRLTPAVAACFDFAQHERVEQEAGAK